jgi:hypothetical protein
MESDPSQQTIYAEEFPAFTGGMVVVEPHGEQNRRPVGTENRTCKFIDLSMTSRN